MAYRISQGSGPRRVIGIVVVVLLHIGFFLGLQAGLVQKAISEIETQVAAVKEAAPPPQEAEPPPPPPPIEEPPPFVPPPDINIATVTTATNAIQQVTNVRPPPDRNPILSAGPGAVNPPYPESSRENCEYGTVGLLLSIDEKGRVTNAVVVQSSGYPALDNSALNHAKTKWRFSPARKDGKPYATDFRINVKFDLLTEFGRRAVEECEREGKGRRGE